VPVLFDPLTLPDAGRFSTEISKKITNEVTCSANFNARRYCLKHHLVEADVSSNSVVKSLKRPVNGVDCIFERTLCVCLQAYCSPPTVYFAKKDRLAYDDLKANDIRWNFEKFLVDRRGVPVIRYSETFLPHDIEDDIRDLLMIPSFT